jgi:hypothetical protein
MMRQELYGRDCSVLKNGEDSISDPAMGGLM